MRGGMHFVPLRIFFVGRKGLCTPRPNAHMSNLLRTPLRTSKLRPYLRTIVWFLGAVILGPGGTTTLLAAELSPHGPVVSIRQNLAETLGSSNKGPLVLARFDPKQRVFEYLSSACLLSPRVAISCAHSVEGESLSSLFVLSVVPGTWVVEYRRIRAFLVDLRYFEGDASYDFVVLYLDPEGNPMEIYETAIPLSAIEGEVLAVGWKDRGNGLYTEVLLQSDDDIRLHMDPMDAPFFRFFLPPKTRIGRGNSGSPLFTTRAGVSTLRGILTTSERDESGVFDEMVCFLSASRFEHFSEGFGWMQDGGFANRYLAVVPGYENIGYWRHQLFQHMSGEEFASVRQWSEGELGELLRDDAKWDASGHSGFEVVGFGENRADGLSHVSSLGVLDLNSLTVLSEDNGTKNGIMWQWNAILELPEGMSSCSVRLNFDSLGIPESQIELTVWSMVTRRVVFRGPVSEMNLEEIYVPEEETLWTVRLGQMVDTPRLTFSITPLAE